MSVRAGGRSGDGGNGAGLCAPSSILTNCFIVHNTTGNGGSCFWYPPDYPFDGNGGSGGNSAGVYGPAAAIMNCTILGNRCGLEGLGVNGGIDGQPGFGSGVFADQDTTIENSILWTNSFDQIYGHDCNNITFCDIENGTCSGLNGNISADPLFANPDGFDNDPNTYEDNDYHLISKAGRWDPNQTSWIYDEVTSPCIDAGNPSDPNWMSELWPHGRRINMGAYGGTPEASMSPSMAGNIADLSYNNCVGLEDLVLFIQEWLNCLVLCPQDINLDGCVDLDDYYLLARNWSTCLDQSLVGHWLFNEDSGIVAHDSSVYANRGILVNGPVWTGNEELSFDGIDDYVEVPDAPSLDITNQITLSVWIYMDQYSTGWPKLVIKPYDLADTDPWELYVLDLGASGDSPRFILTDGTPSGNYAFAYNSQHLLSLGQWHHIVGTYNGTMALLYVDGLFIAEDAATLQIGTNDLPLSIGSRLGYHSFKGFIDEVRIYNRALDETEVQTLYQNYQE